MDILCAAVEHVLQPPTFAPMTAPAVFTLLLTHANQHAALSGLLYKDPSTEIMTVLLNANNISAASALEQNTDTQTYKLKHHYAHPRVFFYLEPAVEGANYYVNHINGPIVSCMAHIGTDGYIFDELCKV